MTSFLGAISHMKALDLKFVTVCWPSISGWSSRAARRKIKNGFSASRTNIADVYLNSPVTMFWTFFPFGLK